MILHLDFVVVVTLSLGRFSGKCDDGKQGPVFIYEPPHRVDFLNSSGSVIDCSAHSNPDPKVFWVDESGDIVNEVPRLRYTPRNGSLVFPSFSSNIYRQDVHTAVYRCKATNTFGTILSTPVRVRAVVKQAYQGQVYDEFVIKGNTALFRCHIPSFVRDYVVVIAWIRGDNYVIRSGPSSGSRYSSFENGYLHIRNVMQNDNNMSYGCQTMHKISGETSLSHSFGKLKVEEPKSIVQPRITHTEQHITCKEGQNVEIPCSAQGFPVPKYRWFKKRADQMIAVTTTERIIQLSGSLIIRNTRAQDEGFYVCFVNNTVQSQQAQTRLTISAPYAVYVLPQKQRVDVNQPADFNCTVTGSPVGSVIWFKDGKQIEIDDRVVLISPLQLRIKKVERQDGGMYQCFGDNGDAAAQGTSQLYLGDVTPVVIKGFRELTLQPGPTVSLSCTGTGNPLPSFEWTLDGQVLQNNHRFSKSQYLTFNRRVVSHLNITNVKSNEGGEYACVSVNKAGKDVYTNRVNIYGLPIIKEMKNRTVVAGEDLKVRCYVAGYPIYEIKWQRDTGPSTLSSRHKVYKNGTLAIRKTKPTTDNGQYTCIARNHKGQSTRRSIWIRVIVKPEIAPIPVPPHIKDGARITLMCSVMMGDPPISKTWLKDGAEIPHQLGVQLTDVGLTSLLEIKDIRTYHNGNYSCLASNTAGSANQTAHIMVEAPPLWVLYPKDSTASLDTDSVIDCATKGHPKPKVAWMKLSNGVKSDIVTDDKHEVFWNGSLKIRSISLEDEGKYICTASNGLEPNLSEEMQLNVGAKPIVTIYYPILTIIVGQEASFKCIANGDLPIHIHWLVNQASISNKNRFFVNTHEVSESLSEKRYESILKIQHVKREDSDEYTCSARNSYGERRRTITLKVTDKPGPPESVKVKSYYNGSMNLEWQKPIDIGNLPLLSYIVQHKLRTEKWPKAKNVTVDALKPFYRLSNLKVNIKYELRVFAMNSNGIGEPGDVIRFMPSQNGTLVLEPIIQESIEEQSVMMTSVVWLVVLVVITIIIIAIIIILALIYFHKKTLSSTLPAYSSQDQRKDENDGIKQSLVDELQKSQIERYGRLGPNKLAEYGVKNSEYGYYAPGTSSAIYTEVEISPYATFSLPDSKNPDDRSTVEMKTFSKRYDVPKIDNINNS